MNSTADQIAGTDNERLYVNKIQVQVEQTIMANKNRNEVQRQEGAGINVVQSKDLLVIKSTSPDKENVPVRKMYISRSRSHKYQTGRRYGGVIIYQYNGKSDWRTANNTHCRTGCIVIQDTDSEGVKRSMSTEDGVVHGAVYLNAFGESKKEAEVVGEGFAIWDGEFKICSGVFNNSQDTFHNESREMAELSQRCVRKIVEYWKAAGPDLASWSRTDRTFEVKDLLQDSPN